MEHLEREREINEYRVVFQSVKAQEQQLKQTSRGMDFDLTLICENDWNKKEFIKQKN